MKKREERVILVSGIKCIVRSEKFPDGKWRDVYRFTVPGWDECEITGLRDTKRVIRGRLDPAVRNTLDIDHEGEKAMNEGYGGRFLKIRKAIYEAGFDEFYQAGSVNKFHKMTIVAESKALNTRFWICIDGGYGVKEEFFIIRRCPSKGGLDQRTYYKNQKDMTVAVDAIGEQIRAAKAVEGGVKK